MGGLGLTAEKGE